MIIDFGDGLNIDWIWPRGKYYFPRRWWQIKYQASIQSNQRGNYALKIVSRIEKGNDIFKGRFDLTKVKHLKKYQILIFFNPNSSLIEILLFLRLIFLGGNIPNNITYWCQYDSQFVSS